MRSEKLAHDFTEYIWFACHQHGVTDHTFYTDSRVKTLNTSAVT